MESITISPEALGLFSVPQYWQKEKVKGENRNKRKEKWEGKRRMGSLKEKKGKQKEKGRERIKRVKRIKMESVLHDDVLWLLLFLLQFNTLVTSK